jgi:hypothetical protein
MTQDPHTDYGPAWTDRSDFHARCCRLEAENARLRARVAELEAEAEAADVRFCRALLHDLRGGRLGWPWLVKVAGL